jgi:glutathione peroxidase
MPTSVESIPVKRIDGATATLGDWAGKVRLVVNVASKCGLTPQYEGLESLQKTYGPKGLAVMGFPANNFGAQEPGENAEIAEFCTTNFGVDFPMFEKISVSGADQHPLYKALIEAQPTAQAHNTAFRERLAGGGRVPPTDKDVLWNFEKFLIDRQGQVVGRFSPEIKPDDPVLTGAIEDALAKG